MGIIFLHEIGDDQKNTLWHQIKENKDKREQIKENEDK